MSSDIINDERIDEEWKPILAKPPKKPVAVWRVKLSNWLSLFAMGFLLFGPLMLAYLYWYAWQKGLYPHSKAAPIQYGGPWSRNEELARYAVAALSPSIYAGALSLLSLLVRPNIRAVVILVLAALVFFLILPSAFLGED